MDRPRDPSHKRNKRIRQVVYAVVGAVAIVALIRFTSGLQAAAPTVDRATVVVAPVMRGELLREVRGPGTLVPETIRWISAGTAGRVEEIVILPGSEVEAETVILRLSNPELVQQAREAELDLRASESELRDLEVQLESQVLKQEAEAARLRAEYEESRLEADAQERLFNEGVEAEIKLKKAELRRDQLRVRADIEDKRLAKIRESLEAQLASKRLVLEQRQALFRLRTEQVEALQVKATLPGVLQQVPVEVGEQVAPGGLLARVAQPDTLKAELRIPETQARDVQIGQRARIDTRNGVAQGRVIRIDPAVQEGTVTVDVAMEGELPRGARPDLSVDGTIELEHLTDVLYTGRITYAQAESRVQVFKLIEDGAVAVRVPVEIGRTSVNQVEVRDGLAEGDEVIVSDMSRWDAYDRIRLN